LKTHEFRVRIFVHCQLNHYPWLWFLNRSFADFLVVIVLTASSCLSEVNSISFLSCTLSRCLQGQRLLRTDLDLITSFLREVSPTIMADRRVYYTPKPTMHSRDSSSDFRTSYPSGRYSDEQSDSREAPREHRDRMADSGLCYSITRTAPPNLN
jgi:hypothetical protein